MRHAHARGGVPCRRREIEENLLLSSVMNNPYYARNIHVWMVSLNRSRQKNTVWVAVMMLAGACHLTAWNFLVSEAISRAFLGPRVFVAFATASLKRFTCLL